MRRSFAPANRARESRKTTRSFGDRPRQCAEVAPRIAGAQSKYASRVIGTGRVYEINARRRERPTATAGPTTGAGRVRPRRPERSELCSAAAPDSRRRDHRLESTGPELGDPDAAFGGNSGCTFGSLPLGNTRSSSDRAGKAARAPDQACCRRAFRRNGAGRLHESARNIRVRVVGRPRRESPSLVHANAHVADESRRRLERISLGRRSLARDVDAAVDLRPAR